MNHACTRHYFRGLGNHSFRKDPRRCDHYGPFGSEEIVAEVDGVQETKEDCGVRGASTVVEESMSVFLATERSRWAVVSSSLSDLVR